MLTDFAMPVVHQGSETNRIVESLLHRVLRNRISEFHDPHECKFALQLPSRELACICLE